MNIKKRIIVFFIFMGLFSLAYQIGSMSEVSEEEALEFMKEFEELIGDIDGVGIFLHNNLISLPMFIPGFGIAWGFYSGWSTGYAFAAIVLLIPELSNIPPSCITLCFSIWIYGVSSLLHRNLKKFHLDSYDY